ncbi:MAG: TIGR04283 family arsenosugar biosynthesis glycosyltransferase [Gemmataceae bacterium]
MRLSVIIPTLNEELFLTRAIHSLRANRTTGIEQEILVADCGSIDKTRDIAANHQIRALTREPRLDSRAAALNFGATHAQGDVLLFVDADTLVPRGYDQAIQQSLRSPRVVGGAFEFALDEKHPNLRLVELVNRIRYRIWPDYYGDQGIFIRAEVFRFVAGYPERKILEASDFCRKVQRVGKMALIRRPMVTSSRRFLEGGILKVLAKDAWIWGRDRLGVSTEQFGRGYQQNNHDRGRNRS